MELSVKEFLDSVTNSNTKKEYRYGVNKFCDWYNKSAEEILLERKEDLTQRPNENLIEYRNRASRFEKEIEKFHSSLLEKYSINTARTLTLGIRQLFRFYEMGIRFRAGSKIAKTVKSNKNFPLTIEYVRRMFDVADLRERVVLSLATDLGLRIGDFIDIKKSDLPPLDKDAPISFDVMTGKEDVVAHGFLSSETVGLLKIYLPTLEKKKENPYLFPSNSKMHISDEWLNRLLAKLVVKAKINLSNKKLTFHCFRKMFLSASIDSGIGLTAGKKLVGKSIARSDDTYLTTVNLRAKFIQLKKFLSITQTPKIDTDQLESLKDAVTNLQEDLTRQKLITETISQDNLKVKEQLGKLDYLVEFVNHFDDYENLKTLLDFFKLEILDEEEETEIYKPIKTEFSPYIRLQLQKIAKIKGISEKEALIEMFSDDVDAMKRAEEKWEEIEKRLKLKSKKS